MNNCIESKLIGEICTIKTPTNYLVGRISGIDIDTFSVEILNPSVEVFEKNSQIEVRIEKLDQDDIYFFITYIDSFKKLNNNLILKLKLISKLQEKNKRQYRRLNLETHSNQSLSILLQTFPPSETARWEKGELLDISQEGVQLKDNNFLSTGQLLEIEIGLPFFGTNQYIISRIVNKTKVANDFIFSVQFLNISTENKQSIEKYIKNALGEI
ncbi:MAG: PilZ domain-containing protein [Vulcanibacillus sp.]